MGIDKPPKRPPEIVIAANNSSSRSKLLADYVCTGTNDQNTIQTAINACSTGGKVLFLAGTYTVTPSTDVYQAGWKAGGVINKSIELKGQPGSIITIPNAIDVGTKGVMIFFLDSASKVRISGLTYLGNSHNITATYNSFVFVAGTSSYVDIENNYFQDSRYPVYGDPATTSNRINIIGNKINNVNGFFNGLALHNYHDYSIIANNQIYQCGTGIFLDTCTGVNVSNNIIQRLVGTAISLYDGVTHCNINNNILIGRDNAADYAIDLYTDISGGKLTCDYNHFSGNLIHKFPGTFLRAHGTGNSFVGNRFPLTGTSSDLGTSTVLSHNPL